MLKLSPNKFSNAGLYLRVVGEGIDHFFLVHVHLKAAQYKTLDLMEYLLGRHAGRQPSPSCPSGECHLPPRTGNPSLPACLFREERRGGESSGRQLGLCVWV